MGILYDGWMILAALLPSIGLLFLFWVILKHIVEGDRRERAALREWEAQRDRDTMRPSAADISPEGTPEKESGAPRTHKPHGSAPHNGDATG
ncbi:hypothetical protein [Ornithinimicrobium tianjinense]|uniref:Uncharacterized protein n=1 Tax=Ornithinimicrobium tianjinense TaxID=1195761 RepID=A0A917BCV6_9MICO|nr:hypothetical protein [Ornithinimicrobium tianjinense]GGF37747.1 hypothetical protein GCM10011366_01580 [Ornithinimicrobium tianjinense]